MAALTELVKISFTITLTGNRPPFPVTATLYWLSATSKGDVTLLNKLAFGYVHA